MSGSGVEKSLLLNGGNPADAPHKKPPEGARRFRRCRTAPSSDPVAPEEARHGPPAPPKPTNGSQSAPSKKLFESTARPSFRLMGLLLLAYLISCSTAFYLAMDHMSGHRSGSRLLDALYFCVVTMTTVGYGDLVPASDTAKLLASAFAFAGVAVVGTFLSKSADYLVEKQESLLFRAAVHANATHPARARLRAMEAAKKTWYKLCTSRLCPVSCRTTDSKVLPRPAPPELQGSGQIPPARTDSLHRPAPPSTLPSAPRPCHSISFAAACRRPEQRKSPPNFVGLMLVVRC